MNIVLLESIANLGRLGSIVKVKSGYARNFLIPQSKAKFASKENLEIFAKMRAELEMKENERLKDIHILSEKLNGTVAVVKSNVGEEGKLFGSVGTAEISRALEEHGFKIERRQIKLPNGNLKLVGVYEIEVHLVMDIIATISVSVEAIANETEN